MPKACRRGFNIIVFFSPVKPNGSIAIRTVFPFFIFKNHSVHESSRVKKYVFNRALFWDASLFIRNMGPNRYIADTCSISPKGHFPDRVEPGGYSHVIGRAVLKYM